MESDENTLKEDILDKGFVKVKIFSIQERTTTFKIYIKWKWKQYGLNHQVTYTTHTS